MNDSRPRPLRSTNYRPREADNHHQNPKLLLIFSLVTVSVASGIVYGWPALRRNLVQQEGSALTENHLGLIFTVGSWSTQGGRFLVGIIRDRFLGTKITATLCITATAAGIVGIAFADKNNCTSLAVSFCLVGLGSGAQLCLQPVAGMFADRFHGTILASLSGAFQVSGLVFLILMNISNDRRKALGPFAIGLFMLAIFAVRFLPKKNFSKFQENIPDEEQQHGNEIRGDSASEDASDNEIGGDSTSEDASTKFNVCTNGDDYAEINNEEENVSSAILVGERNSNPPKIDTNRDEKGPLALIRTWEYFLLLIWFSTQLIPLQYYIAAIGFQLERMGDDTGRYTSIFSVIYASSAVLAPLLGKIADTAGLGIAQALATVLTSSSFLVLAFGQAVPLDGHVAGMVCYGIGRMIVFGMFFTNIGKRFGYTHFGTLAGLGLIVSAIFSLLQYPLISMSAAGHEQMVNITCSVVLLIQGLPYCFWLMRRENREN